MSSVEHPTRGRINLRIDPRQEARLRAAAEVSGETLTGFMLSAAGVRADDVLEHAGRIELDRAAFAKFVEALDSADEPMPTLTRYARESSPIPPR